MTSETKKKARLPAYLSVGLALISGLGVTSAYAQLTVFDPSNYAQNILQAAHALSQVNNQIQQLQHEAQMLQNMATNLKPLKVSALIKINADLTAINQLMVDAKGIAFSLSQTEAALKAQFPGSYSGSVSASALNSSALNSAALARWDSTMQAYQNTLRIQSQVDQALQGDAGTLSSLLDASEKSEGSLQVQQASNQLLALTAKQEMQIETLMAAQYRAEALDAARKAEGEAAARAAAKVFIGTASAYSQP